MCSPEQLVKLSNTAKDEIGETGKDLEASIKRVKRLVSEKYPDLQLPKENFDDFVTRCLRVRKFDESRAVKQVHSYFKFLKEVRESHKEMYFLPSVLHTYYEAFGIASLKHRDDKGRSVMSVRFEKLENFCVCKFFVACILLMDELARDSVETQRIGLNIIVHLTGFNLEHAKQCSLSRIRQVTKLLQGSYPMRFKQFHVVNAPPIFICVFNVMKLFLGEKLKRRIFVHGSELSGLHEKVSPEILPDYLGGKLDNDQYVDSECIKRLMSRDDHYKELFARGYTQLKFDG